MSVEKKTLGCRTGFSRERMNLGTSGLKPLLQTGEDAALLGRRPLTLVAEMTLRW